MLKIGLTGGIGSGKTIVSDEFAKLGVSIIDTDVIARQVLISDTDLLNELANTFGKEILKGQVLDRNKLRELAFANDKSKAKLDKIMHPAIRQATLNEMSSVEAKNEFNYYIIVVPLLVETNFNKLVDRVLVVSAPHYLKLKWLDKRSGLSASQAEKIMSKQCSDEEKIALADDHIVNDKDIESLKEETQKLHALYQKLSKTQ